MQAHTGFTTPLLKAAKAFVMLLPVVTIGEIYYATLYIHAVS